MGLTTGQSH